ncbi:MAG: hypothetical protein JW869_07740, partial [Candidatus Omnitrophica bacterium]|nr:hypothetical protein [Candidatus Omnitrophota bacterium]
MKGRFICALDIGTVKICALCARQDQAGKIDILANHTRPAAGLRAGRVVNSKKLSTSIKEAVVEIRKACGIKLSRVFVNIDSPDLRARVSEERLSSTLASRYGANKLNRLLQGVAADHVDLDRKVIYAECRRMVAAHRSDDGPRAKVAVLSALIPTIKTYSKSIKDAGLVLEGMVPSGLAQALGLFRNVCNDICAHRLIVDFGGGSTKLTLFEDGLVKAVKLLPIGAQDITDDIAIKLKIS